MAPLFKSAPSALSSRQCPLAAARPPPMPSRGEPASPADVLLRATREGHPRAQWAPGHCLGASADVSLAPERMPNELSESKERKGAPLLLVGRSPIQLAARSRAPARDSSRQRRQISSAPHLNSGSSAAPRQLLGGLVGVCSLSAAAAKGRPRPLTKQPTPRP